MSKIMRVYYDNAGHPYKDYALSILYPIVGNEFTGANNTSEIHFYCDNMGEATWVANCVLPNGEKVNRLLVSGVDGDGHTYQVLPLDSQLTSVKGHLKIGLNGYAGNISIDEEELENNDIVVISGTPTIIATGIIDIAMNYSPIIIPVSQLTPSEYQELLALIGTKADVINTIYCTNDITLLDPSAYNEGQIFFSKSNSLFYKVENAQFVLLDTAPNKVDKSNDPSILYGTTDTGAQTTYTFNDVADQIEGIILSDYYTKVESDARYVRQTNSPYRVYHTDSNGDQTTTPLDWEATNYTIALRYNGGTLKVGTPTDDEHATTKKYVDDNIQNVREVAEGKCRTIVLSYSATSVGVNSFYDVDGNLHQYTEFSDFVDGLQAGNTLFNSNNNSISIPATSGWLGYHYYFILYSLGNDYVYPTGTYIVVKDYELCSLLHNGDIILITETDVPDRWFVNSSPTATLHKLETSKIDLTNYYTKNANLVPTTNNAYDLGTITTRYKDLYLSNYIYLGVSGIIKYTTSGFEFNSHIVPAVDNLYNLGSMANHFNQGHISNIYTSRISNSDGSKNVPFNELYNSVYHEITYPTSIISYGVWNTILISSDTTFTFGAAPTGTYPEYHGSITASLGQSITLTFTGVNTILCNDDNIVITNATNSTMVLPSGTSIEFSIQGGRMVAINWSAN